MFFEVGTQAFRDEVIHDALDFEIAELRLGLTFKLRIRHFDRNDAGQPFTDIIAGKVRFIVLENVILACVFIEDAGERGAETGKVHTAFDGIDVIDEGIHAFAVACLVLHRDVDDDLILLAFESDDGRIDKILAFIQELDEFRDAAGVVEFLLVGRTVAQVCQRDGEAFIQKSQLAHADLQGIIVEVHAFFENLDIRLEGDRGARLLRFSVGLHVLGDFPAGQFHFMEMPFTAHHDACPFGERIHDRDADAVQTAGNRIAVAAEFAACMEHRQYDFHGRFPSLVHARRNAATIVRDCTAAVIIERHFDVRAVARECFVDTVVDDFVDQMVQAARGCRADVHARTQAYRFEPFEDSDVTRAVVFLAILFAVTSLDFMNIFRHGILLTKKWRPVMHDRLLFIYIYISEP